MHRYQPAHYALVRSICKLPLQELAALAGHANEPKLVQLRDQWALFAKDHPEYISVAESWQAFWPARCREYFAIHNAVLFTTAPVNYDGFGSETIEWQPFNNSKGNQFRRVGCHPDHVHWQRERYWSGLYEAETPEEFQKLVSLNLVTPFPLGKL